MDNSSIVAARAILSHILEARLNAMMKWPVCGRACGGLGVGQGELLLLRGLTLELA